MKIENADVPAVLHYAKPGEISRSPTRPSARPGSNVADLRRSGTRPLSGEEHRRGQRVLLRVRAQIHVALNGKATTFDVFTLSVNPHGAMVVLDKCLIPGTRLVLENVTTREKVACKVARQPRESAEGYQVPLEFDSPAPRFWRIAFPPADWRPED